MGHELSRSSFGHVSSARTVLGPNRQRDPADAYPRRPILLEPWVNMLVERMLAYMTRIVGSSTNQKPPGRLYGGASIPTEAL